MDRDGERDRMREGGRERDKEGGRSQKPTEQSEKRNEKWSFVSFGVKIEVSKITHRVQRTEIIIETKNGSQVKGKQKAAGSQTYHEEHMLFSETQTWVTDSAFRLHLPTLSDWHSALTFRMILLG